MPISKTDMTEFSREICDLCQTLQFLPPPHGLSSRPASRTNTTNYTDYFQTNNIDSYVTHMDEKVCMSCCCQISTWRKILSRPSFRAARVLFLGSCRP